MNYCILDIAFIIKAKHKNIKEYIISELLTDSRSVTFAEHTLFFAITSTKNDGHKYIDALYKKGVRNFVVSSKYKIPEEISDANFLVVKDTLKALQTLAKEHRKKFNIPVIGITGSNGKTVVKEWLYQLIQSDKYITRSPRSYNSQIGVPLSVWQISEQTNHAIFEAGISEKDEMQNLQEIINPNIGILTNIGEAHQENFISIREKLDEKLKLFRNCDIIIFNGDDPNISQALEEACMTMREIAWSRKDHNKQLFIRNIEKGPFSTTLHYIYLGFEGKYTIPFIEDASIENSITCLATMLYFGYLPDTIEERMALLEPVAMRMEVKEGRNNCLIINDSYNSDINSLDIALDFLNRRATKERKNTLILSDILQTGLLPRTLYKKIADLCERKGINKIIGIGRDISEFAEYFKCENYFFQSTFEYMNSALIDSFKDELILIKGARNYNFEQISEYLELKQHETILEVNLDAVVHNYNVYRKKLKPTTKMVCMVKALGYGAGPLELAKTLQDQGCEYLAVAVADEGAELRKQGIHIPIIVMNPEFSAFRTIFTYNLEPEIYSFKLLKAFIHEAEKYGITNFPIHVKIDTGMHRLGFEPDEIEQLAEVLCKQSTVTVRSVFSHLAGSDNKDLDYYTNQQIEIFKEATELLEQYLGYNFLKHILNTAGIERFPEAQMDMVRLGIGLYGIEGSFEKVSLRNISTLRSVILQIHNFKKDDTVGYGRKGVLKRDSRVAAVPIGYADGYNRHLSNGVGYMLVNGCNCPVVGNVCMDVTLIDVTDCDCQEGDNVIIFGDELPVSVLAEKLDTISYELISTVSARVKRIYFRE